MRQDLMAKTAVSAPYLQLKEMGQRVESIAQTRQGEEEAKTDAIPDRECH